MLNIIIGILSNLPILGKSKAFNKWLHSFTAFLRGLKKDQIIIVVAMISLLLVSLMWNVKQYLDIQMGIKYLKAMKAVNTACYEYVKRMDGKRVKFTEFHSYVEVKKQDLLFSAVMEKKKI